jgi:hypothetical protein
MMIKRTMEQTVRSALEAFPIVALLGPRQVGKTTTALAIAGSIERTLVYLDLERDSDRNKLSDAELYLSSKGESSLFLTRCSGDLICFPFYAVWSMSVAVRASGLDTFSSWARRRVISYSNHQKAWLVVLPIWNFPLSRSPN